MPGIAVPGTASTLVVARTTTAGIVATATVAGVRYSYGVVLLGLSTHTGDPVGFLALGTALHWIVMSVSAPLAWRLYIRIGPRGMMLLGGTLCATAFAVLPTTTAGILCLIAYGVLSGLGSHGLGQLVANRPLVSSMPAGGRRDRLFGMIAAGAPVGTAVFPATAALAISAFGWAPGCICIAGTVLAASQTGAALTPRIARTQQSHIEKTPAERNPRLWRTLSFPLLATGFAVALFIQVSVPFVIPLWGVSGGYSAGDVAVAFVVLGCAGLVGRLVMTRRMVLWGLRLWIVLPASFVGSTGFVVAAVAPSGSTWFLPGVALMGFATPVIGALFAIASLACFPEEWFTRVAGTLLIPIGIASAGSAVIPGAIVDAGLPLSTTWLVFAGLSVVAAAALIGAELASPLRHGSQTVQEQVSPTRRTTRETRVRPSGGRAPE